MAIWTFCGDRANADTPAFTMTSYSFNIANSAHFSLGYTFQITSPVTVTALGSIDFGGTSIAATGARPVAIYYSNDPPVGGPVDGHNSGDPVPGASATVSATDPILGTDGGTYSFGDGFRYHTLTTPVTLTPGTYEIATANLGTGYAYQWSGIANAPGVSAPLEGTFSNTPTDFVTYGQSTEHWGIEGGIGGLAGPNFLTAVPEPSATALIFLASAPLVRSRRRR